MGEQDRDAERVGARHPQRLARRAARAPEHARRERRGADERGRLEHGEQEVARDRGQDDAMHRERVEEVVQPPPHHVLAVARRLARDRVVEVERRAHDALVSAEPVDRPPQRRRFENFLEVHALLRRSGLWSGLRRGAGRRCRGRRSGLWSGHRRRCGCRCRRGRSRRSGLWSGLRRRGSRRSRRRGRGRRRRPQPCLGLIVRGTTAEEPATSFGSLIGAIPRHRPRTRAAVSLSFTNSCYGFIFHFSRLDALLTSLCDPARWTGVRRTIKAPSISVSRLNSL